jgi:hypothetical protein
MANCADSDWLGIGSALVNQPGLPNPVNVSVVKVEHRVVWRCGRSHVSAYPDVNLIVHTEG